MLAQGAPLSPATRRRVRRLIPPFGADSNPVDMTPQMDPGNYGRCVRAVLADPRIGAAAAINVGLDRPEFGEAFAGSRKPVAAFTVDAPTIAERFRAAGIPMFPSPERAVRALAALADRPRLPAAARYAAAQAGPRLPTLDARMPAGRPRNLQDPLSLLRRFGVPVCRQIRGATVAQALAAAETIGYPVALKSLAAHKTDRGEVVLDIGGPRALERAARRIRPFVVQPMVPGDLEAIVGARRDPTFGAVVALGPGGVFAERMGEPVLRLCPADGREMAAAFPFLGAYRGRASAARAVARIVRAVSRLMLSNRRIVEIDISPVRIHAGRAVAVDALIITV